MKLCTALEVFIVSLHPNLKKAHDNPNAARETSAVDEIELIDNSNGECRKSNKE